MYENMKKVMILAGGLGSRFNSKKPKQFQLMRGKMMIEYVIQACLCEVKAYNIYIVCHPGWVKYLSSKIKIPCKVIEGGESRVSSTFLGLKAMNCKNDDFIYIVESNRPLLKSFWMRRLYLSLKGEPTKYAAIYKNNITESIFMLKKISFRSAPKANFFTTQTPYLFKGAAIEKILKRTGKDMSDELDILSIIDSTKILKTEATFNNIKVTTRKDFKAALALL